MKGTEEFTATGAGAKALIARILEVLLRLSVLILFVLLFTPAANPARITEKINRNLSLFTSGFLYQSLTSDMGRILQKGWVQESTMRLLFLASMAACLGILALCAGACLSLGNAAMKRLAYLLGAAGGLIVLGASWGIERARALFLATSDLDRAKPLDPAGMGVLLLLGALALALSLLCLALAPRPPKGERLRIESRMELFLLLMPFLVLVFLFMYLPLWGWRYAFYDYKPGEALTADKFVGLKWFSYLFQNEATVRDGLRVLRNTLAMSGLGILTSWCPMAFAIFLAEIKNTRVRRVVQTLTTVPNFISWVLVYAVAFCIFSTDGFVSSVMVNAGAWPSGHNLLMGDGHIWLKMLGWGMWKGLGWSAIMYIAAITAIDPQLYEAATVDGAGRFRKMWSITVPELVPTYMVLLLLSISGLLSNGMEQYLMFENPTNTSPIVVLDLYVYKLGIGLGKGLIPLATLVGMMKSLVSVALLFGANGISKLVRGESIV
jgi:putative aldouronate transport system permease protein